MRPLPPEALYALSADPWTLGHSSVLEKARERYRGRVLVGIANDSKKHYAFAQWERLRLAQKSLDVPPEDVRLVPGSLAKYLMREDVPNLVRWVRNVLDQAAEATLKFYYLRENPNLAVDIVDADPSSPYAEISSSGVKESLKVGHDISSFVSSTVKQALESRLVGQYPVCVTGEMGAGKSTFSRSVADEARKLGIPCTYVDFDSIAHEIYFSLTDPIYEKARRKVAEIFGESVVTADGFIDRTELARIVRENPGSMEKLNAVLRQPMLLRYGDLIAGKRGLVLVDGALLVEFGLTHFGNHHAVLVGAPVETRMRRVVERYAQWGRTMSEGDVRKMFSLQMDNAAKSEALKALISKNRNGSVTEIDNGTNPPNAKRALFEILSNVDVFGELRTKIVLGALGISEMDAEAGYAELKKKHEEPHRFYHTWEHVVELLDHLFDAAAETSLTNEEIGVVGTAALFHDSVYEIDRTYYRDNEIHSANYAKKWLTNHHVNHKRVEEIYSLVRETAHTKHITELEIPRGMPERYGFLFGLLHDIDMAILGSSPERYSLYVSDIVREFGIYPGREFAKGRLELLDKWIADDDLFVTAYGKTRFLPQARENMAAEAARLRTVVQGKQ